MCRPLKKRDESLGSDVDLKYLNYLLTLLEDPYSQYYSRGYLNSEGLTILYKVLRILSRVDKSLLNMLKTCFKNRDYEHIVNKIRIVRERLGLEYGRESFEEYIASGEMFKIYRPTLRYREGERFYNKDITGD